MIKVLKFERIKYSFKFTINGHISYDNILGEFSCSLWLLVRLSNTLIRLKLFLKSYKNNMYIAIIIL